MLRVCFFQTQAIFELINTEVAYVRDLQLIVEVCLSDITFFFSFVCAHHNVARFSIRACSSYSL